MEGKIVVPDRLDGLDAERFAEMLSSPPFALFRGRIYQELERARADCETFTEPAQIHRAQGRCASLRTVVLLPEIMLREMRTRKQA